MGAPSGLDGSERHQPAPGFHWSGGHLPEGGSLSVSGPCWFSVLFFVSLILSLMMVNNDDADENLLASLCIIF